MPAVKHVHAGAHRSWAKAFLFPATLCALSFSAGLMCAVLSSPMRSRSFGLPIFNRTRLVGEPCISQYGNDSSGFATATSRNTQAPLGLEWYKKSYDNPWQASVKRTGIEDLLPLYNHVLERDGKLPRVVVSFTSLPKRLIKHARRTVEILKSQSYMPDAIYVAIPKGARRTDAEFQIPTWLKNDPLITILRPETDMGPATKLIPAVEAELKLGNLNTRIITVDDDNEGNWSAESLLSLYAYSLFYEDAAIGLTGWNVTCMTTEARCDPKDSGIPRRQFPDRMYNFIKPADDYACHSLADWLPEYYSNCLGAIRKNYVGFADVIEGYKGALYQPRFFPIEKLKTVTDKRKTPEYFFLCDDVWFSGWLSVKKIQRIIVNPAIHEDAKVRLELVKYGERRNLSRELLPMSKKDRQVQIELKEAEESLHGLGNDFVKANHDAVVWFERRGGWTKGMWKRPEGFRYPSELNKTTPDDIQVA